MIRKVLALSVIPFLIGLAVFVVVCQKPIATESRNANNKTDEVTIYVSTDRVFSEPILKAYERKPGVKVNAVYITHDRAEALAVAQRIWEPAHQMNFLAGGKRERL